MTQTFQLGASTTDAASYLTDQLNGNLEALRTNF